MIGAVIFYLVLGSLVVGAVCMLLDSDDLYRPMR